MGEGVRSPRRGSAEEVLGDFELALPDTRKATDDERAVIRVALAGVRAAF